jgi:hypothetical protein
MVMNESRLLDLASTKKVLFCGESIVDVYHYVRPLGRPTKDAILSVELVSTERFSGGVVAAGAHAEPFCNKVEYYFGGDEIHKERFVEESHFHKLFQVYKTTPGQNKSLPNFKDFDAVVVIDYGHGMATDHFMDAINILGANYLAINVQTNSGNYGYNLCTKYAHCDYLCIDESEARLATQNRTGPIEQCIDVLRHWTDKLVITLGKKGAIGWSADSDIVRCPAFTSSVVDTMGAGDAFFAITALVAKESDMMTLLRIGNAAGAIKSQIVGHRGSIHRNELVAYLERVR